MSKLGLFVKVGSHYKEVDSFLLDKYSNHITKSLIVDAVNKYIVNCTSNKCVKNQYSENLYFKKMVSFLENKSLINIDQVTPEHIDEFESLLLKNMKVSSVNRRFNTIKNFFKKCHEWELINKNPCQNKKKRREERNPRKPWNHQQFLSFIEKCSGVRKNIFLFLWLTGCRPVEVKNLKWTDIDYDQLTITLRSGKNSQVSRRFPLTDEISNMLHNIRVESIYVFSENKKQINNDQLYHYCKKRMKALGFNNLSPYGSRHGFGTKLANQGVSAFHIAELMGHSKMETTRQYIHTEKKQLHEILRLVN